MQIVLSLKSKHTIKRGKKIPFNFHFLRIWNAIPLILEIHNQHFLSHTTPFLCPTFAIRFLGFLERNPINLEIWQPTYLVLHNSFSCARLYPKDSENYSDIQIQEPLNFEK